MNLPPAVAVLLLIVFGFLVGSNIYFYDQWRANTVATGSSSQSVKFSGKIPNLNTPTAADQALTANAKPGVPGNSLSYPANVYTVQTNDSLFSIGTKMSLSWQLIENANGITNANVIQAAYPLVIPALDQDTDYYRVNFLINNDVATSLNLQLRNSATSDYFDPVKVAEMDAVPYFNLSAGDNYSLADENLSAGTAAVEVKNSGNLVADVGLIQPKIKGSKGLWAVLYVEDRADNTSTP